MKQKVRPSFFKSNTCWNLSIVLVSVLVLAFYIWMVGSNGVPLIVDVGPEHHEQIRTPNLFPDISPHHYGYYNLMADAFENGKLHLLIEPPQEMLDLPNPRDPKANWRWRIADFCLFEKHFYVYFGAVPTLFLFLPFRMLGIGKISEPLAVAIFSYALFLASLYLLLACVKKFIPNANRWLIFLGILSIATANSIPYVLRHPVSYEVAIVSGAFFSMLGLSFLFRSYNDKTFSVKWMSLASLALGLSVGCRPIYGVTSIFIFGFWILISTQKPFQIKNSILNAAALAIPFSIVSLFLMLYNFLRFKSIFDFGMLHDLPADLHAQEHMSSFANMPPSLFLSVFCPPSFDNIFPFIHLKPFYPFQFPPGYFNEEPNGGFIFTSPITIYSILFIGLWKLKRRISTAELVATLLTVFGFIIMLIEKFYMISTTQRYQLDWITTILLGSVIGCIYLQSKISNHIGKIIATVIISILMVFGIVAHLAFGVTGIFDTLRRGEPRQYFALENFFRPVSALLTPVFGSDQTKILDITIPNGSARFEDGTEGPWLGEEGFYVRFTAAQSMPMQFSADVVARPDLPDGVNLEFQNPAGSSKSSVVKGISRQTFQFTLQPGSNRISIFANPNGPIVTDQDKLRLAILKNIQIAPISSK